MNDPLVVPVTLKVRPRLKRLPYVWKQYRLLREMGLPVVASLRVALVILK